MEPEPSASQVHTSSPAQGLRSLSEPRGGWHRRSSGRGHGRTHTHPLHIDAQWTSKHTQEPVRDPPCHALHRSRDPKGHVLKHGVCRHNAEIWWISKGWGLIDIPGGEPHPPQGVGVALPSGPSPSPGEQAVIKQEHSALEPFHTRDHLALVLVTATQNQPRGSMKTFFCSQRASYSCKTGRGTCTLEGRGAEGSPILEESTDPKCGWNS